jgi:hypothetical protein
MKSILLILLAVFPFICFGQSQDNKLARLQTKRDSLMNNIISIKNQIAEIDKEIEIIAAGGHNINLVDPPDARKIMLAKTPEILPPSTLKEALKTIKIHSVSEIIDKEISLMTNDLLKDIGNKTSENKKIATSVITMDATLRTNPARGDNVITIIKKGENVDVLSIENDYYKISYKNSVGYISDFYLNDPALRQIAEKQKKEVIELERNKRYQDLVKIFGTISANRIINHETWIGMTTFEAIASLGLPKDVNKTEGTFGIHEQWVYGEIPYTKYLYFENGKLTIIQY